MGVKRAGCVVALAGNPNVGKSTVFNALTGAHQHTGNWPGKTVATARGSFRSPARDYTLVDLPGTYSLQPHSAEEEAARDFLCFGAPEAVVVVCDATCLERGVHLALQAMELQKRVLVCVNLMDEARRKGVAPELPLLARRLGVPVVGTAARQRRSLGRLVQALDALCAAPEAPAGCAVDYGPAVEAALAQVVPELARLCPALPGRYVALRLLEEDESLLRALRARPEGTLLTDAGLCAALRAARQGLRQAGLTGPDRLHDAVADAQTARAAALCRDAARPGGYSTRDQRLDRLLTSRRTGYPVMLAALAGILWLTMAGANGLSGHLAALLAPVQPALRAGLQALHAPAWLQGALADGVWRVLAWVVSVMLPPMAIFFPLFTLLEDAGYLPRVAYNLDKPFQRCRACGKQALCMCMGFGCNAAGVTGCRIVDSPRERLLAILTNSFVPCNGRFPVLAAVLTMFFAGTAGGLRGAAISALGLTALIVLSVAMTFAATRLLSGTLLRGVPSSYTLELPPYRRPQLGRVLVRSVLDRTVFVLGRAAAVAAPAGLLIWALANIAPGGVSLLARCAGVLDPLGRLMGLDGVILLAFVLGLPANEIVLPIVIMAYTAQGALVQLEDLTRLRALLTAHGWTPVTAVSMLLFTLNHWPCSTTLLTVKKETGSWAWTAVAAALPTAAGILLCILWTTLAHWLGL